MVILNAMLSKLKCILVPMGAMQDPKMLKGHHCKRVDQRNQDKPSCHETCSNGPRCEGVFAILHALLPALTRAAIGTST